MTQLSEPSRKDRRTTLKTNKELEEMWIWRLPNTNDALGSGNKKWNNETIIE
jgi:hypothetical protein